MIEISQLLHMRYDHPNTKFQTFLWQVKELIIVLPHNECTCLTIIKFDCSLKSTCCFGVDNCDMCDFVMLLISWSSTFKSVWVCAFDFFSVTVPSLILSAATPVCSWSWKTDTSEWSPDDLCSKLDRVVFKRWCHFLEELIGQRAVPVYPVISISDVTCNCSAYVSMEVIFNKNWIAIVVMQNQDLTLSYLATPNPVL